ncbi:hypothetical protein BWQ96_01731 [Gracilariopsis chorda]|uniref:Uncharacterized protein n=1 Tax=Gracilariopsis chorda TaxID=448386 RepID=A0A2V3J375_9FLOR|nr:hypothetical protein BWQ96_01731 [Gracilariopsis chorda]|eukprot:PXF48562.1 hypothetical protein BWQ96_01731 [Gracilariopsis chorda]
MPRVCTGIASSSDCDTAKPTKPIAAVAMDAFRQFLDRGKEAAQTVSAPMTTSRERRRLQAAESYIQMRMAGNNEKLLNLVSDDIQLLSSRDGTFVGKDQFSDYLDKVKPTGTWENATWNDDIDRAQILGRVKFLVVNVGVVAHMGFDKSDKINRIYVGTRSKSPK